MVSTWLPTDASFFSPQGFSMQGQYSGVSPAEVSVPVAVGSVHTRMGAAGNVCLGRHWGTADLCHHP